ncbi:MAG: PAS domain S-box protein [Bacteroidetes bacterium]|nr:PAS domain S-box protein [Bacteroidota bacterium]
MFKVNLIDDIGSTAQANGPSVIISETDLRGNIVYANESFCNLSGYSMEELIGKPHNIIRHPSMPKDLFKLMWTTIQGGEVFRAVIKNRMKSGDHYWVNATIMPVFQGGEIIRYIGGRHHIKDDLLAEDLYRKQLIKLGWMLPKP